MEGYRNKLKNMILYAGLDRETNAYYRDFILKQDVTNLTLYLHIAGALFLMLGVASILTSGFAHKNTIVYLFTAMAFLLILILQKVTIRRRGLTSDVNRIYIYLFMVVLYVEAIVLTVMHRDVPAVTYIGILLILPLLFAQYPLPMILFQGVFVTVFCVCVSCFKVPKIAAIDRWNGITFLLVSIIVILLMIPMRFKQIIQPEIIRELSEKDLLTGLKNRNSFSLFCRECNQTKPSLVCIYADANGLHELNNAYGHEAGDRMLKTVGTVIKENFGTEHTYRVGGDEFVIFSLECNEEEAERLVRKMKKNISEAGYAVSMGVACSENGTEEMEAIVKRAEARMYSDKNAYYSAFGQDRRQR